MLDPKLIRETPDAVRAAIAKKHLEVDLDAMLAIDTAWRAHLQEVEGLRGKQKAANVAMATLPKGSPEFVAKVGEMKAVSLQIKEREAQLNETEGKFRSAMLSIPNLPHASVPEGRTPAENVVFSLHGSHEMPRPHALPHWEITGFDKLFDFARGAKVTGAGFPFYVGDGARLVRSLLQFFLDENAKVGYVEVAPPIFVNAASATATGQLPDKEGQMYETADHLYAVPTAEVPLTNFYRDEIVDEAMLPIYRCAYTPCFRREAGSYGKDVRGLNRLHQFDKVELLKWVHPATSYDELDKLREDAERLLRKLDLPYRVLLMCGGDLGFAQSKKYDLEVWSAGQKRWLEVSSCSNFEAFQARRAQIRFRAKESGKPELVHTINGSGLAVPRVLSALLENNLEPDGRVKIPPALVPYFGKEYLSFQ